jgi:hypothetical protein
MVRTFILEQIFSINFNNIINNFQYKNNKIFILIKFSTNISVLNCTIFKIVKTFYNRIFIFY